MDKGDVYIKKSNKIQVIIIEVVNGFVSFHEKHYMNIKTMIEEDFSNAYEKKEYNKFLINIYGGTLRKVIKDLVTQVDDLKSVPKLDKEEKIQLFDLIEMSNEAIEVYNNSYNGVLQPIQKVK